VELCVYVYVNVCTYVYMFVRIHIYIFVRVCIHVGLMYMDVCVYLRMCLWLLIQQLHKTNETLGGGGAKEC
jgi:hypothetical protein